MNNTKARDVITNIILIILSIAFVVLMFLFIQQMKYQSNSSYFHDVDSLAYDIQDERYTSLVRRVYENRMTQEKATEELLEIYAVADYYEALFLYQAYEEVGNKEQADMYQNKMEDAAAKMGAFSYLKEDIDSKLDIDKLDF